MIAKVRDGALWQLARLYRLSAYIVDGVLTADPVAGFPAGTTPEMVHHTVQAAVQNASRGVSTLLLIATSLVIAAWFATDGRRRWAWFYGTAISIVFMALAAVGFGVGVNLSHRPFSQRPGSG